MFRKRWKALTWLEVVFIKKKTPYYLHSMLDTRLV